MGRLSHAGQKRGESKDAQSGLWNERVACGPLGVSRGVRVTTITVTAAAGGWALQPLPRPCLLASVNCLPGQGSALAGHRAGGLREAGAIPVSLGWGDPRRPSPAGVRLPSLAFERAGLGVGPLQTPPFCGVDAAL